jgi:hypothetical protein
MIKQYKFYGTISFSGYVVIEADNEMLARQRAMRGNFDGVEALVSDKDIKFEWDLEDPENL